MELIFLGSPGAGKGTVAADIKGQLNIPHVSTGDLFREAIKNGTELGRKVKDILDRGDLVPDELTTDIVKERLNKKDAESGYILDGFPRTIGQAEALKEFSEITAVINFIVSEEQVIRRLSGRRLCKNCGKSYHIEYLPPKRNNICDVCGSALYMRDDDRIEAVKNRLNVYKKSTQPLIDYYEKTGLLIDIDAGGTPEEVTKSILQVLKKR